VADDEYGLTAAQAVVFALLSSTWTSLSSPTVVVLDAPTGRGKTRIVQALYDSRTEAQVEGRRFWRGRLAENDLGAWRQARKTVAPDLVDITQRPDWLWFGLEGYSSGRVDLFGSVQRLNRTIVDGYESGKLPSTEPLQRGTGRGIPSGLLKAAVDLIADILPGGGLAKTGVETSLAVAKAVARRNEFGLPLSIENPALTARAILVTSFATSMLGQLDRALAPILVVVDDAHLLDSSAVATLDRLIRANPENELLGSGLLAGKQREYAASRGVPPVAPVLLLATSQPLSESQPNFFGAQLSLWGRRGCTITTVGDDRLPLISEDEAVSVVSARLGDLDLNVEQLRLIAEYAHDHVPCGVNASLLVAHCERVWRLTSPHETLTPEWADIHLPRFIEEDARRRYEGLPTQAQKAVVAGSLRGPAFAQRAVPMLLPELSQADDWADELQNSGYVQRSVILNEAQFVFSDEPSFAYTRTLAVRDSTLCANALTTLSAPLIRNLWTSSPVGPAAHGPALYELSRREAYQFRELVDEARLRGETIDSEIWAAALGFGSEQQFILEQLRDDGRGPMRQLWSDL
jgi:hypothetical protein